MVELSLNLSANDLERLNALLAAVVGDYAPKVSFQTPSEASIRFYEPSSSKISALLEQALVAEPKGDMKLAAAYAIGSVSWSVSLVLSALALDEKWVTGLPPDSLSVTPRLQTWKENGSKGAFYLYDVTLDPSELEVSNATMHPKFGSAIEGIFKDLVEALAQQSKLSRAALWKLVADHVGEAFLAIGTHTGATKQAISWAQALFRNKTSKLYNKQADFAWVEVPEASEKSAWMLRKGGCCRYYTLTNSPDDYCATCVLRDDASQVAKFEDYLRSS